jgi:nucleoside-diphosphate-sugar epimerase
MQADLTDSTLPDRLPRTTAILSAAPIWLLPSVLPGLLKSCPARLVAFSSTSRFTKIDSDILYERQLAQQLMRGESEIERICEIAGVRWTILRPTLIYAEGRDRNVSRLAGLIHRIGFLPLAGRGEGLRQPVHADDLAAGAIAAANSPLAANKAYNLTGGETLTYREMAGRIFDALGRRRIVISLPVWMWRAAFAMAKPLLPGASAGMGMRMAENLVFDSGPAKADFGWAPRPFEPDFSAE